MKNLSTAEIQSINDVAADMVVSWSQELRAIAANQGAPSLFEGAFLSPEPTTDRKTATDALRRMAASLLNTAASLDHAD